MKSKLTFDLNSQNQPVILGQISHTDDVRDKIAQRFKEGFGTTGNLALVQFYSATAGGGTEIWMCPFDGTLSRMQEMIVYLSDEQINNLHQAIIQDLPRRNIPKVEGCVMSPIESCRLIEGMFNTFTLLHNLREKMSMFNSGPEIWFGIYAKPFLEGNVGDPPVTESKKLKRNYLETLAHHELTEVIITNMLSISPEQKQKEKNILTEQVKHSIADCLRELKWGRPGDGQKFIDKCIKEADKLFGKKS